eukprot:TRINITY_DN2953_c0_g1_i7.p1 TRINITY_DN2953_c0_g1~~TRINITY_DN2953_c0_g1_i7.p1  ORF type:complete len:364 (+),score=79.03 TRINITY_DN2953_c0_g1_i7:147-1238(+)
MLYSHMKKEPAATLAVKPSTRSSFPKLKVLPETFIIKIAVEEAIKVGDHYEFVLRVFGRSRFFSYLPTARFTSYTYMARYRKLKMLHNVMKEELSKCEGEAKCLMPKFPKESWLDSKKHAAEKRIKEFNEYFDSLILNFAQTVIFSETLANVFAACPMDVLVLAANKGGRNRYLNAVIRRLFNDVEDLKGTGSEMTASSSTLPYDYVRMNSSVQCILPSSITEKSYSSLWKQYIPFDFVSNDRLFRIDCVNLHFSSKTSIHTLLSLTAKVFILIDASSKTWLADFKEHLYAIAKHNKTVTESINSVVGIVVNSEVAGKDYDAELVKAVGSMVLDKSVLFICRECFLITGEGALEAFDDLLKTI